MLAYTLAKGVEDLTSKFGKFNSSAWKPKQAKSLHYSHLFSSSELLKDNFSMQRPGIGGGKRTLLSSSSTFDDASSSFTASHGSVFRSIFDLSEPTSAYFIPDVEIDQTWLYSKRELEFGGLGHIYQNDRYFRLPTKEMASMIRFQLKENAESIFLHPVEIQARPEKPAGGCPFGYT